MLFYSQSKGIWTDDQGEVIVAGCYAGNGQWKNDPASQALRDHGPLPRGKYSISPPHTIPHLGLAMCLTPAPTNEMYGRGGFFAHLENRAHPGESSDGCVVFENDAVGLSGYQKLIKIGMLLAIAGNQLTVTA
jgi:Tlde1 domain